MKVKSVIIFAYNTVKLALSVCFMTKVDTRRVSF